MVLFSARAARDGRNCRAHESKENRFGYFLFGNIGYRYQRTNGFMFRVGLSPSFNFGDKHGIIKSAFYPYIGLGWSF